MISKANFIPETTVQLYLLKSQISNQKSCPHVRQRQIPRPAGDNSTGQSKTRFIDHGGRVCRFRNGSCAFRGPNRRSSIVLPNPGEALTWTAAPLHAFEFGKSVSGLQFTDSGTLVITAGSDVAVWNFTQPKPEPLNGHSAQITGLDVIGQTAVTGDDSGTSRQSMRTTEKPSSHLD